MKESKKTGLRIASLLLCLTLACGGSIAVVCASGDKESDSSTATSASSQTASSSSTVVTASSNADSAPYKEETVYVLANADGTARKIIVSDWLKNPGGETSLGDYTDLSDVSCVKGDASYTMGSDGARIWDAQSGDVYYQGTSDRQLPVEVTVRYTLDGQPISAEDLVGKSGKVAIRYDYQNTLTTEATINGKTETIHVPFAVLTGMILGNDHFRNIEVTNGKLVNDGDHTVVAGVALPGLSDDLDLDREKLNLPEYVEITADAEDFTLSNTVTLASSSLFGSVDVDDASGLDDLTDALSQLTDAMTQLMDGSSALYDGLNTLLDKSGDLISGIDQLAAGSAQLSAGASSLKDGASTLASGASSLKDGASQLKSGLDTLTANNDTLNAGARQVFESLLSMANTQLKSAGLSVETLTIENYGKVLDGVLASLDSDAVWKLAYNTASDQVTAAVYAKKDYIRSQVSQVVEGQVLAGVLQASGTGLTVEQYQTAVAAGQIPAETQAAITAAVSQQMASEAIQAQIDAATSQQIDQLIQQNLNSSEVQSQIDAAINKAAAGENSIAALKAQLDSYNQFYQGLKTYTAGVASADAGAARLDTGAAALKEGAGQLSDGASSLKEGADALNSGILALKDGSAALVDGVTQLRDGAMQLSDGLKEFNEKGVQKLTDAVSGDLGALTERIRAISDAAKAYQSYGGIAGGMDGKVNFIYRTDAIEK